MAAVMTNDPLDEHTVVGCVATAMSQIMYYWKWPNTGEDNEDVDYDYRWRDTWDEDPSQLIPGLIWVHLGAGETIASGGLLQVVAGCG
jgi:hypothetical protein